MSEDWVKSMSTNTKGDGQCGLQVPHSTFSEQLGGQSASPISNSAGAQERTSVQDSDSNNAGGKDDVEANITGGARLAQGNAEMSLLKRVVDQMQDQINDIKEKGVETLASFEELHKARHGSVIHQPYYTRGIHSVR